MNKQFVTYEIGSKLNELGFDEPCFAYFMNKDLHIYSNHIEFDGVSASKLDIRNSKITDMHKKIFKIEFTAPLWQQVIDWFNENFNYIIKYNSYKQTMEKDILLGIEYQKIIKK